MKKITIIVALLLISIYVKAQLPALEWARGLSSYYGIEVSKGKSIVVDPFGNTYITGVFQGTVDFDLSSGVFNLTTNMNGPYYSENVFILKLNAYGDFVWAKQMKGSGTNIFSGGTSIYSDATGNIYTTGYFTGGVDFDPGSGSDSLISSFDTFCAFVSKLDVSGNHVWAKKIGGTNNSDYVTGQHITVDPLGNVFTTGTFAGTIDLNPGTGVYNLSSLSGNDMFISKLDSFGSFIWAKQMVGDSASVTYVGSSVLDASGNIYTFGHFSGTIDFDPGAGVVNLSSLSTDVFISKLDSSGNFILVKNIAGASTSEGISAMAGGIDASNNLYLSGVFYGTVDFDSGAGTMNLTAHSLFGSTFVVKLDNSASLLWVKSMSGVSTTASGLANAVPYSLSLDGAGNVYTTGVLYGVFDFNPGAPVDTLSEASGSNAFILKLDPSGNYTWAINIGEDTGILYGNSIAVDTYNNIYTVGYFQGDADFDPSAGVFNLSTDQNDLYINKLSQEPAGIYEYGNSNTISVFPNPSSGVFNITISELKENTIIEVYNSIGVLVHSKELVSVQANIDLINQSNGMYYIKVTSENEIIGTQKIIKQ